MPKKYDISTEAQVLLRLLRIALGTEPMAADGRPMTADGTPVPVEGIPASEGSTPVEPFPQDIDWREVIRLSYKQKVSSLAVDGLKASGYDPREGKSERQLEELNAVLKPWFDDVKNNEESYAYYLTVLSTLCQVFSSNGLKPILLKGYGLSLNYPIPSHRGAGDIDFYLLDENDRPAGKRGDELLQGQYAALFHKMEHQNSYHTQYSFKGIIIENHYNIIGEFFDPRREQDLESYLEELIADGYTPAPDVEGAYLPSTRFTALHLLRHSFSHCYFGGLNLRQLVDCYCFMQRVEGQLPLEKEVLRMSGLAAFADCLKDILPVVFEGKVAQNPASEMIIADIFVPRQGKGGIRNFFHWYHDRRKIWFLTGESWVKLTIESVIRHIN